MSTKQAVPQALKVYIEREIQYALSALGTHYGICPPRIEIRWDLRGRSRLATATSDRMIRLNPAYAIALGEKYRATAVHEACHIITSSRQLKARAVGSVAARTLDWSAHGGEWKKAMRLLGEAPNRCATREEMLMSTSVKPARKLKTYIYVCGCGTEYKLTSIIHNKIARGQGRRCTICKTPVRLKV